MAKVIFYEKPGCGGNARQKALLKASGHELEVRDLLSEAWTPETLRPFFGTRPVSSWFNPSAPRIKSGEINPDMIGASKALAMMIEDPLLIRRPLIQVGTRRETGFEQDQVDIWIGLSKTREPVDETCLKAKAGV
ncbi:ArsC/Spx/MgsR family protein [Methyloceanibacter sp. wino2]|uniref:ArsC/Spx/MgsR family protein n=1 Tax=Methyloceanibacter sp. wino2 TaxID=2170729 RepID=UPI000D3E1F86|nr:ArsC/Spx/MgsR family protein [Methyloceanibacter sp. wino2]